MIDINTQILPQEWMHFSQEVKDHMRELFGIKKSGHVEVLDNKVVTDGHTLEDLQSVSVTKMQLYTSSKSDNFRELLTLTIEKIQNGKKESSTSTEDKGGDKISDGEGAESKKVPKARKGRTLSNSIAA